MGHRVFAGEDHVAAGRVDLDAFHHQRRGEAPEKGVAEQRTAAGREERFAGGDGDRRDDRPGSEILQRAPTEALLQVLGERRIDDGPVGHAWNVEKSVRPIRGGTRSTCGNRPTRRNRHKEAVLYRPLVRCLLSYSSFRSDRRMNRFCERDRCDFAIWPVW